MYITVKELLIYTDEERARWERWFLANGNELLDMPVGGEGEPTIGKLIMHIFGPELRYVERLRNEPLTDYHALPATSVETIFGFGLKTRQTLRDYISELSADDWERVADWNHTSASVRKIIFDALTHEIRHWSQISLIMRERGLTPPAGQDLLTSRALR